MRIEGFEDWRAQAQQEHWVQIFIAPPQPPVQAPQAAMAASAQAANELPLTHGLPWRNNRVDRFVGGSKVAMDNSDDASTSDDSDKSDRPGASRSDFCTWPTREVHSTVTGEPRLCRRGELSNHLGNRL